jgi:DNA primase
MPCQDLTRHKVCPGPAGRREPRGAGLTRAIARASGSPAPAHPRGDRKLSVGVAASVKEKLDIVELIGETVPLKRAGTTFKGLCPFHGEKTPSFVVTPSRETWKCFGCGRGGDLFNFVMERDGVDFPTALRQLAGRAGVELSERTSREDALRKRLREALDAAIAFYHQVLTSHPAGAPAREYLQSRGFTDATIETYQLGFAPDAWDALTSALTRRRGLSEADLEAAGLVSRRGQGRSSQGRSSQGRSGQGTRGVYDRFRNRIIFPIRDASGGATGLGGRILGTQGPDTGPKYLNTPATLLFDKSRTLYLIDRAKGAIRRSGRAVLVEGNTDALMAHQQGFENVVGSLGTALTAGQVELITRYAPRIALAYDVDVAGQDAATFGATELTALVGEIERSPYRGRLTDVDMVRLPEGRDPDEVIRDTPDAWREATEEPQPIMEFLIDRAARRHDPRTVTGRERLVSAVMPTLRTVTDPVRRDGYLQVLARRAGVDERTLLEVLRRPAEGMGRGGRSARGGAEGGHVGGRINLEAVMAQPDALDPRAVERALEPAEATLLRLLLIRPSFVAEMTSRLRPEDLVTTPARELWRALGAAAGAEAEAPFDRSAFLDGLEPTLAAIGRTLLARTDPQPETEEGLRQALDQSLLAIERGRLSESLDFARAQLAEAEAADDGAEVERLQQEVLDLQRRRFDLDREAASTTLLSRRRRTAQPSRISTSTVPSIASTGGTT